MVVKVIDTLATFFRVLFHHELVVNLKHVLVEVIVAVLRNLTFSRVEVVHIFEALVCKDLVITDFKSFEVRVQLAVLSLGVAIFTQVPSSFSPTKAFVLKAAFLSFLKELSLVFWAFSYLRSK